MSTQNKPRKKCNKNKGTKQGEKERVNIVWGEAHLALGTLLVFCAA